MKTEEIVRALRCCAEPGRECEEDCPMNEISREPCREVLAPAAADLLEKLTARCARYAEEIAVAQERTRWVPVEERLPEISNSWGVSDVVLCIISDPSGYPPPNPGLCIYLEDGRWTCHGMFVRVTHWMRMPKGPEE